MQPPHTNNNHQLIACASANTLPKPVWLDQNQIQESYIPYLSDESKLQGNAERLSFPASESELQAILVAARQAHMRLTISGARTGITGGAVPDNGWLISLEKMNNCLALRQLPDNLGFILTCQPGLTLDALNHALASCLFPGIKTWDQPSLQALAALKTAPPHLFPPDPTERSASLGGMIACNASGARTLHYGPTRPYIERLRILLASGHSLDIKRNQYRTSSNNSFQLLIPNQQLQTGHIPNLQRPGLKNAAGYFAEPNMDLLDLFIGAEGTLGIITEADLRIIPAPDAILAAVGFFESDHNALCFVEAARSGLHLPNTPDPQRKPLAIEYFDPHSIELLREQKARIGPSSPIPNLPSSPCAAIYIELACTEDTLEPTAESLLELLAQCNSNPDLAWCATTQTENEALKAFRHALPEAVNQRIGERATRFPGLTKLGTDFAVPDSALHQIMAAYHDVLDSGSLEFVIFGHIGNNHVHVNILPRNLEEHAHGKQLYIELARRTLALEGTVSAEHGIGKLKKNMLLLMYGEQGIREMRQIKHIFDPDNILNPGNLFELNS